MLGRRRLGFPAYPLRHRVHRGGARITARYLHCNGNRDLVRRRHDDGYVGVSPTSIRDAGYRCRPAGCGACACSSWVSSSRDFFAGFVFSRSPTSWRSAMARLPRWRSRSPHCFPTSCGLAAMLVAFGLIFESLTGTPFARRCNRRRARHRRLHGDRRPVGRRADRLSAAHDHRHRPRRYCSTVVLDRCRRLGRCRHRNFPKVRSG